MRKIRAAAMATALAVAGFAGFAPARAAEPLKITISWAVVPGQLTAVLFAPQEALKYYGKSYTVELTHFRGSTPQITSLASGNIDFASLAFSSFGLAIQNAHLNDIRVVADLYQDGIPGYYTNEYMVRTDGGINKPEDLKGKIVATNAIGGAVDIASKKYLLNHGLVSNRDYQVVEVQFPNMLASIKEKKVDLATMIMPFSIEAHRQSNLKTLFTVGQAMGPAQTTLLVGRAPYIAAHRAALVDFFEDWIRALHWFYDPKNREQAIKILADFTKKPPSEYSDWLFTHKDYYRNPNAMPNLQALQNNLNTQKDLGFLKIAIDVKKYADVSLVTDAAKRVH